MVVRYAVVVVLFVENEVCCYCKCNHSQHGLSCILAIQHGGIQWLDGNVHDLKDDNTLNVNVSYDASRMALHLS